MLKVWKLLRKELPEPANTAGAIVAHLLYTGFGGFIAYAGTRSLVWMAKRGVPKLSGLKAALLAVAPTVVMTLAGMGLVLLGLIMIYGTLRSKWSTKPQSSV